MSAPAGPLNEGSLAMRSPAWLLAAPFLFFVSASPAVEPPTTVFFGYPFQGDAVIWCIDKSESMGGDNILQVKVDVTQGILALDADAQFSIVTYSTNYIAWSLAPVPATPENKAAAIAFVNSILTSGWTCMEAPLLEALDILAQASGTELHIFVAGDGVPVCNGVDESQAVLDNVTAANTLGVSIHTALVGVDPGGAPFFQALADLNDGSFIRANGIRFRRGDVNGDGVFDGVSDAVYLLDYLFFTPCPNPPCARAADANDDGAVNITDAVFLLYYQFVAGSPPPPAPGPEECGVDLTPDPLPCVGSPCP